MSDDGVLESILAELEQVKKERDEARKAADLPALLKRQAEMLAESDEFVQKVQRLEAERDEAIKDAEEWASKFWAAEAERDRLIRWHDDICDCGHWEEHDGPPALASMEGDK